MTRLIYPPRTRLRRRTEVGEVAGARAAGESAAVEVVSFAEAVALFASGGPSAPASDRRPIGAGLAR